MEKLVASTRASSRSTTPPLGSRLRRHLPRQGRDARSGHPTGHRGAGRQPGRPGAGHPLRYWRATSSSSTPIISSRSSARAAPRANEPCLPLDVCLIVGEPFASFVAEHQPQAVALDHLGRGGRDPDRRARARPCASRVLQGRDARPLLRHLQLLLVLLRRDAGAPQRRADAGVVGLREPVGSRRVHRLRRVRRVRASSRALAGRRAAAWSTWRRAWAAACASTSARRARCRSSGTRARASRSKWMCCWPKPWRVSVDRAGSPPRHFDPARLPPLIMTSEPGSFAHNTFEVRVPAILRDTIAAERLSARDRRRRSKSCTRSSCRAHPPSAGRCAGRRVLEPRSAPYFGRTWLDVPWYWAEAYFYRRVLEATGYFQPGPRRASTRMRRPSAGSGRPTPRRRPWSGCWTSCPATGRPDSMQLRFEALLHASLWGNRTDLSYMVAAHLGATGRPGRGTRQPAGGRLGRGARRICGRGQRTRRDPGRQRRHRAADGRRAGRLPAGAPACPKRSTCTSSRSRSSSLTP